MATRAPLQIGEWYHCFNRGVDKRSIFEDSRDYERFLVHLYVSNGTRNIRISSLPNTRLKEVVANQKIDRGESLVEIGAYALMPSHPHLLMRQVRENGIALFMQKVFTGYTMYFNNKYTRTGSLFAGTFKSKHILDDLYLKRVLPYVLLNPVELFEPRWKNGVGFLPRIAKKLEDYPYTNLSNFLQKGNPHEKIATTDWSAYYEKIPTLKEMLQEAQAYYAERNLAG